MLRRRTSRRDANDRSETIESAAACHGHMCPGLTLGSRAAQVGVDAFGPRAGDEELVAVVETDMCGADGIQALVGCTFGKGNLVHRDHGKNVFTFFRRVDGRAMRVSMRAGGWGRPTEWESLYAVIREGRAEDGQRQRFAALQRERSEAILSTPSRSSTPSKRWRRRCLLPPASWPPSSAPPAGSRPWRRAYGVLAAGSSACPASTTPERNDARRLPSPLGVTPCSSAALIHLEVLPCDAVA